ncbi:MAG: hypothetical protein QOD68_2066 [Actinomycetota bacterium]|nr:hypothetical protein [Actinomycetota bacterium]
MPDEGWAPLADELAADVRRVADRLRTLSAARLAGPPAPPEDGMPPYRSRAQAARGAAQAMADAAAALERVAVGSGGFQWRPLPELADFAAGDQVAVTGHDLLAALELVPPDTDVYWDVLEHGPARLQVEQAARLLADVRRRL